MEPKIMIGDVQIKLDSVHKRAECPTSVKGKFKTSFEAYTVARKGRTTLIGRSGANTWAGSRPSPAVVIPDAPSVLVIMETHGNGANRFVRLYCDRTYEKLKKLKNDRA